ncbi:MAG: TIGR03936 family radical SAM-associated protein [Planctomycetota bacterium]
MAGRPVRVYLEATGDARFLSHLDLLRVLERAIRRSRLEVDYTEGFHPRVRISLPQAVPVGVGSSGDHFTIRVDPGVAPGTIMSRLVDVVPSGIRIAGVEEGPPSREPRWVRLSIEVMNGHAAASSAATALREGGGGCYSRATAHEGAVILELSGEGAKGRPPRTREVVKCVEETLMTLGFVGGIGEVVRQVGRMPSGPADS